MDLRLEFAQGVLERLAGPRACLPRLGFGALLAAAGGSVLGARPVGVAARREPVAVVVEVAVERRERAVGDQHQRVGRGAQQVAVVRDQHHRALVLLQCERHRLPHVEIEMVGRLVEEKQVRLLPYHEREREPGALAAGEPGDRRKRHVARKIEAAQEVAECLLARRAVEPPQVLERRLVRPQHFERVLREVADPQSLAFLARARERRQEAGGELDERRLPRAVASEQADPRARLDCQLEVREHRHAVVAGRGVLEDEHRIGAAGELAEVEIERRVDVCRCDPLHPRQRLQAALRLARLGRLRAEAVDERFEARDLALLAGVERLLVRQALGPRILERRVVAGVAAQSPVLEADDGRGDGIEKLAVVGDQGERALVAAEPALQPDDCIEIEVVRGLVEQQQVRRAHQRAREVEPHAPAAGEFGDAPLEVRRREAQAVEHRRGARARRVAVPVRERLVRVREALAVAGALGVGELALGAPQRLVAVDRELDRRAVERGRFLGDVRDRPAGRQLDVAAIGVQLAAEQREQARLPAPVRAHHADPFARVEGEVRRVEE